MTAEQLMNACIPLMKYKTTYQPDVQSFKPVEIVLPTMFFIGISNTEILHKTK